MYLYILEITQNHLTSYDNIQLTILYIEKKN